MQNSSGTLRLRNKADAVLFEMTYTGDPPYPPQADGTGHSLVLARPSYGERDHRAWAASSATGGNPGSPDPQNAQTYRSLMINEILAHTDLPDVDFVELYNYGNTPLNVGGVILTDDPDTNKYVIATGTSIAPQGFLVLTEAQLGFALSASGETLYLKHPSARVVIDVIRFEAQENGVATGRYPDGARGFNRLTQPTPGAPNTTPRAPAVVINELMFDPITGEPDDEYVELHNPLPSSVNVGGWRLRDGISFDIPNGTIIPANGYLVIARNAIRLRSRYPHLNTANCLGNYSGSLANNGERIELNFPDEVVSTNTAGQLRTNTIHIPIDEVTYESGGRWGSWSGGGGSSLELRDARADHRVGPNWGDSDESAKSGWVTVEATGVLDNGWADAYQLHVTLLGAGESLVDNIELIPAGSTNVIGNGTFETGVGGWVFQGNHNETGWQSGEGFGSAASLHLRATGRGDSGANRVRTQLPYTLAPGATVTLRAKVRWLKGSPNILLRVRGNWMEAPGYVLAANNLGTPAQLNTRAVPNAGPAITEVRHYPALPAANEPVLIVARVSDPDRLAYLAVNYRVDPDTNFTAIAMTNNGAGLFSTVLPPRAAGTTVAFHVHAIDNFAPPAASTFPERAPSEECVVRWGDNAIPGSLGIYRFWITQTNINRWAREEKMSNKAKDITFIYGTNRIVYNAGAWFHGSPYHSPAYDSPVGNACDYDLRFPDDDRLLGETDINLFRPGNGGGDGTGQREIHGYWFGAEFGIPFLYHRPVIVFVNGQRRETVFHDAQQPNGDFVEQWFPDDPDGDLHKIMLGFEFGDQATGANESGYAVVGANLGRYTTTGGAMKQARYRQTWPRRAASAQELNDYTNIFQLVNVVLTNAAVGSEAYTVALESAVDVEEWYQVHVTQHLYNNPDSFSYGGGQNAFAYKPERNTWKLFLWDVDFAFGGSPTDPNLLGIGGADHGPRNTHPPFARIYWQALIEAANGMLSANRSGTILDARYNGMVAGGAAVGSPQPIKDFIATRRAFILSQIASNQSTFAITSNNGADFTTNRNLITLTGRAPLDVRQLLVNGAPYPIVWISVNTWMVRIPLFSGTNVLIFSALDSKGAVVPGVTGSLRVNYTGADERPEDKIAINEIMYHPAKANAAYVELFNTSLANAFDLSGWRLDGIDFDFPNGTVLEPGAYLLAVENQAGFVDAYGPSTVISGVFNGRFDHGGETLTLLRPDSIPDSMVPVDQVTYDDDSPWNPAADGFGPSLQLVDVSQDNNRVANWTAAAAALTNPPQSVLAITHTWRYSTNDAFNDAGWAVPTYNDAAWLTGPALLYFEDAALPAAKSTQIARGRTTYYFRTHFTFNGSLAGAALQFSTVLDDGAVFYLNGQEIHRLRMAAGPMNYSLFASAGVGDATFEGPFVVPGSALRAGDNVLAVEVHQQNSTSSDLVFGMTLDVIYSTAAPFTPGVANSTRMPIPAFPTLWLNELLPNNLVIGTNRLLDRFGEAEPWLEVYNGGTNTLNLGGLFLADGYTNLGSWQFPPNTLIGPGQFRLIWLDGEPQESDANELHASFRIPLTAGTVVLSRGTNLADIIDYLNYSTAVPGHSFGSYPDGAVSRRRTFPIRTPAAPNNPTAPPINVRINEWMADNLGSLADPADADFEDWFELYNPDPEAIDLTGSHLSDNAANPTLWSVPDGTVIPGHGYLLVWADGEPNQNSPSRNDLHAGFSMAKSGESIALFAANGTLVDLVNFGPQSTDLSQGRYPDGESAVQTFDFATPRLANVLSLENTAPVLAPIAPRTVSEGSMLQIQLEAVDAQLPTQSLSFTFGSVVPTGATLDSATGLLRWTPTESQGPASYTLTFVVTDNGVPALSATQSVSVTVFEVNNPPVVIPANSITLPEGGSLLVTNTATDPDPDPQQLTFTLEPGFPAGMTLHPTSGVLAWNSSEADGPGTFTIGIKATDDGTPPLSAVASFTVLVTEINTAPSLPILPDRTIAVGSILQFDAGATDADLPLQVLGYSLVPPFPAEAIVDAASGHFSWTPTAADVGVHQIVVRVADDGVPPMLATDAFNVVVEEDLRLTVTRTEAGLLIGFNSLAGQNYQVETTDQLGAGAWMPVGESVTAAGSVTTIDLPAPSQGQAFYRVMRGN
ncbi:MAG TPA: lamin tail domain-containing protein [Verrucomicrobiae bacterium]|nr:lamin tail domain-containing protein [Verrucomicrobiae bacterium]